MVLSAAFPLAVLCTSPARVRSSSAAVLAWWSVLVGLAVFLVFAIRGRSDFGDLMWGTQMALFLVFVESLRLTLGHPSPATDPAADPAADPVEGPSDHVAPAPRGAGRVLVLGALAGQVVCGVVFWALEIVDPVAWW
jgi:hypothetical protein